MPVVDWMKNAVFYQIFVDRFYRGNQEKDDSYINMAWDEKPTPKSFAGGDIRGIIKKLDYLESLGITAIYLTPIFFVRIFLRLVENLTKTKILRHFCSFSYTFASNRQKTMLNQKK